MTVLVTGGAGYIGSHMVYALVEAGESVVVIDNLSTGFSDLPPDGVPLLVGDAGDESAGRRASIAEHDVESVIDFAGSVVVPDSMRDPLGYYRNNTMTTRALLNAAIEGGVDRFIFSSTAAVYGNPDQTPVPENAPTRPLSPYGSSKLMTEIMLHDVACAHGMSYVVLRYFNVAGADPQARIGLATVGATHLLKIAVEAATASAPRSTSSAPTIRRRTEAASAISSMSATCPGASRGAVLSARRRRVGDAELRLRPRLFGARDHRGGPACVGPQFRRCICAAPARRHHDDGRRHQPHPRMLDWTPQYDDLDTIATHALAWE